MRHSACTIALGVALLAIAGGVSAEAPQVAPQQRVRFNEHVRPILAANCFSCHGFDGKQRKADLRLDDAKNALADRDGHFVIKPGDPGASEAWLRIISTDSTEMMPPPETKKTLSKDQKETIRQWIEQGAVYQKHWAFEAVTKSQTPAVRDAEWVRNEVDRFILARLEREGLAPRPEADKPTLIRRVAFALTGLPPSVSEVDAYQNDSRPNAYEAMVERYLESPHFGEEFARHWLDVARYGDTHGLHLDNERQMWAYRDWVVQAFNENLPFDQFTIWQLAGDLLPNPTREQQIATGFNRCNVTTGEGGSITEELLYRYAVDRTGTTLQTWMGLTAGCAQCHDHKFDPLTTKEFYQLYAFFNSAADPGMDGNVMDTPPFLKMPSANYAAELAAANKKEAEVVAQLEAALQQANIADPAETTAALPLRSVRDEIIDDAIPYGTTVVNSNRSDPAWIVDPEFGAKSGRRVLEIDYPGSLRVNLGFPLRPLVAPYAGRLEGWLRVDASRPPSTFRIQVSTGKGNHEADWGQSSKRSKSAKSLEMGPLPEGDEWVRFVIPLDGLGIERGAIITGMVLSESGGRVWVDDLRLCGESDVADDPLASFIVWWRTCHEQKLGKLSDELNALPEKTIEALKAGPVATCAAEVRDALHRLYQTRIARKERSLVGKLRQEVADARLARLMAEDTVVGTFVYRDLEKPRESFVMLRGQYDKRGDPVVPDTPAAFPPLSRSNAEAPATRLDLARWLVSAEHPLTARVAVNRFWQQLFGIGLVKTSDDFGTQGTPPSHPELLDWLAAEFMSSTPSPLAAQPTEKLAGAALTPSSATPPARPLQRGGVAWDVKALVRLLVNSATFRQQARASLEVLERDPENRLYARGPRFRLDAEQIRDNALFVSGLLNLQMGGRGVKPYQPPNIWEPVGYADSNTRYYVQDHGSALYRRGLYCFLKRTAPAPFMSNFDGPSREQMCARRERSNTPLQALQLMNDVQFFEAARALGERALIEAGPGDAERIDFLYRTVLARRPDRDERRVVGDFLATERSLYNSELSSAKQTLHVGESSPRGWASAGETAAWTLVANMLLNLDETVTRN